MKKRFLQAFSFLLAFIFLSVSALAWEVPGGWDNFSRALRVIPNGTATAPAWAFQSEQTLGFYRSAAGVISLAGGNLSLGTNELLLDSLKLNDSDDSHYLEILTNSNLTADRILTITPGDSARTITLTGNPTLADWFDQAVKTTSTPIFGTIYGSSSASGTLTLSSTSHATKGNISIGRLTLSDLANSDGIVFGSLGTATKAIDLSGSNLSGDTDYQIYIGASDYWAASGKVVFTGPVGIGVTEPGELLALQKDQNAATQLRVRNDTSGTAAQSSMSVNYGDWTQYGSFSQWNASFTTNGLLAANAVGLFSSANNTAGLRVFTLGTNDLTLGTNNAANVTIQNGGNVGVNEIAPIYTVDVDGPINSQKYYWVEEFDDEVSGVQFEAGLQADFWVTAGTNYAAANVTYTAGPGGTLKAMCAAADNDSVTSLGVLNANVTQNPIMEVRVKIDVKETAAFYVGFASAAFADVNGAFPADAFLVGINSDNGHAFGATQIVAASVDAGAAVDYDDMGSAIVSDTYIKIKIDLTDTEQPRVWINDTEVAAGSITGTVQAGVALAPYFIVQNLAGGAIQRFITLDHFKVWQDRG